MGLFTNWEEKGDDYRRTNQWEKAVQCYEKAKTQKGVDVHYIWHKMYSVVLKHTKEVKYAFKGESIESICKIAIEYTKMRGGDSLREAVIYFYTYNYVGPIISNAERLRLATSFLEKIDDKSEQYKEASKHLEHLKELVYYDDQRLKQKEQSLASEGVKIINKQGGFYPHIEERPNQRVQDLPKYTNYYGMCVDNYYDNAYETSISCSYNGWEISCSTDILSKAIFIEEGTVYRDLVAKVYCVALEGGGRDFYEYGSQINSSVKNDVKQSIVGSVLASKAEEKFLNELSKIYGVKYVSGYKLRARITKIEFADSVKFTYRYFK